MQWSGWMLLIGLVLLSTTPAPASPSNASPRELKALRAALKKQQRLKEQRSSSSASGINGKGVGGVGGGGGAGTAGSSSIGGSGEYVPDAGPWASSSMDGGGGKEPSCEQLREMWRQSKRHSRAAEATNEIPQYADPFARAAALHYGRQRQQQLGFSGAEPTLRPRQERRPVVYGRLHSSPSSLDGQEVVDRPPRPFDVLRKLSRTESADGGSASPSDGQNSGPRSGVVLYGEEDRSPFPKSPAKGSLQHLRELVREEQGGQLPSGVKGSFQQLRDIVREENREGRPSSSSSSGGRSSDWSDADVGRVVTSPSDHSSSSGVGGSKYSLFAMQGDAPYESPSSSLSASSSNNRRPAGNNNNNNNYNRLSSFGKSHHRNHNINRQQMSDLLASDPTAAAAASSAAVMASRRPFQLRDPPRPKIGSSRLVGSSQRAANNNRWSSSSSGGPAHSSTNDDDLGVVRGYVAGGGRTNANPFYSSPPAKPSRRSSALADEEEEDDCGDFGEESDPFCRIHSDCRCASLALGVQQQRCQRGRCVPMQSNRNGQQQQKRQQMRNQHQKRKSSTSLRRRRLEDDEDDDEWRTSDRDVESRLEQLLQEEQQQQQQSEDEEESSTDENRSSSRLSGRKADAIRDIIDALQQIDQQQESTD